MTQEHPIAPPPELVSRWSTSLECPDLPSKKAIYIATQAARWGADQELQACCQWMVNRYGEESHAMGLLRAARRPKPPSLKEQALDELHISFDRGYLKEGAADIIRRALEALPDD